MPRLRSRGVACRFRYDLSIHHFIATLAPRAGDPPKVCWKIGRAVTHRGRVAVSLTSNADNFSGVLDVPTTRELEEAGVRVRYLPVAHRPLLHSAEMGRARDEEVRQASVLHFNGLCSHR